MVVRVLGTIHSSELNPMVCINGKLMHKTLENMYLNDVVSITHRLVSNVI